MASPVMRPNFFGQPSFYYRHDPATGRPVHTLPGPPGKSDVELAEIMVVDMVMESPWWASALTAIGENLQKAVVGKPRTNKTGRQVKLSMRMGGHKFTLGFCPRDTKDGFNRSLESLEDEVVEGMVTNLLRDAKSEKKGFWDLCKDPMIWARTVRELRVSKPNCSLPMFEIVLARKIWSMRPQGEDGIRRAALAAREFLSAGGLERNFGGHQTKKAMEVLRASALHAFKHGGNLDEMLEVVRAALVESLVNS